MSLLLLFVLQVSDNPFQISLQTGEGYLPEAEDKSVLDRIDNQLRMLLPEEEVTAMCSSQYTVDRQVNVLHITHITVK